MSGDTEEIRIHNDITPEAMAARLEAEARDGSAPVRRRGRPLGSKNKKPPRGRNLDDIDNAADPDPDPPMSKEELQAELERLKQAAEPIVPMVYAAWAPFYDRWFPDMPYQPEEAEGFAIALTQVSEKYGDVITKWGPEIALLMATISPFLQRQMMKKSNAQLAHPDNRPDRNGKNDDR